MGRIRNATASVVLALVAAGCTSVSTVARLSAVPAPSRTPALASAVAPPISQVTPTPSAAATIPPSSPAPTWRLTKRPADCLAKRLTARFAPALSGAGGGSEEVVIVFRNVGAAPCWLSGLPRLTGVDSNGRVWLLRFQASKNRAYADAWPANGPGAVFPGGLGALHLSVADGNCTKKGVVHLRLDIALRWHQVVSMPFPAELGVTGCLGNEGEIGPVFYPLD